MFYFCFDAVKCRLNLIEVGEIDCWNLRSLSLGVTSIYYFFFLFLLKLSYIDFAALSMLKSTEVWFFFTRRILKDDLVIRETPSGVWLSDGDVKHIKDKSDRFIGTNQSFKFYLKPNNTPLEETNWMMEEYQRALQVWFTFHHQIRLLPLNLLMLCLILVRWITMVLSCARFS